MYYVIEKSDSDHILHSFESEAFLVRSDVYRNSQAPIILLTDDGTVKLLTGDECEAIWMKYGEIVKLEDKIGLAAEELAKATEQLATLQRALAEAYSRIEGE